ncbi:MAG: polyprenyl synthetase family protein [Myxococcota bacterium]|nr:polyprenyl synthetase family protein [Myxococcota bacterium]
MDPRAYLLDASSLVDAGLDAALPVASEPPERLHAAMRHLVFPGGKRLRPGLACAAAEAVGATPDAALPMGVSVELVHTWSLVHDDLPCMDDDDERRGRPTVHVAFDEATAVLAGDALLALAFEALLAPGNDLALRADAARELAQAAGAGALVGGQVSDLAFDLSVADVAQVESIHARKTAALITAAIVGGAILGGATPEETKGLRAFGRGIGIAFQLADDLIDSGEGGCSLVSLIGEEAARERGEELLEQALAELAPFGGRAEALRGLGLFALRRKE